jgi:hypothetical protein
VRRAGRDCGGPECFQLLVVERGERRRRRKRRNGGMH